jgi:hypothetical protein
MPKHPTITMRIGAGYDTVTVDGHTFDRAAMDRPSRRKLTRLVVGGLEQSGYFGERK